MNKNHILSLLFVFFFTTLLYSQTLSEIGNDLNVFEHLNLDDQEIAIQGYDPVAYLEDNRAKKGRSQFTHKHQGVVYYFSSQKNLALFKKSPDKYLPQYGGWCAYAMGDYGEKVSINPESFLVRDNKLYLFYKTFFTNTKEKWLDDIDALQKNADINWKKTITK
jgi:YHS domain-containing protein